MSLSSARLPTGIPSLAGVPPYPAQSLVPLVGMDIQLPADDTWVHGTGTPAHSYLDGARGAWRETAEWMDYLDPTSPVHALKMIERDIYVHWWQPWLNASRVMDVGCGIGRMLIPFLDRGADAWGVDADHESLSRCIAWCAGRPGRLDLHWSSVHTLPEVYELDVVIACEVLCYVPEIERALDQIVKRLRPGGTLLLSMEARWGWALAEDAPEGALDEAIEGTGIINRPGDRWVRTWDESELRHLLERAGLQVELLERTHYVTDGPLERCQPAVMTLSTLLETEDRCRRHPVWAPLHRIWTAAATRR